MKGCLLIDFFSDIFSIYYLAGLLNILVSQSYFDLQKYFVIFFHKGENVVFNAQVALEDFFEKVVGNLYKDPFFAFDVATFLHDNLESLCYKTLILERFFPNLLKVRH